MTSCPLKGKADIDKYFRIELSPPHVITLTVKRLRRLKSNPPRHHFTPYCYEEDRFYRCCNDKVPIYNTIIPFPHTPRYLLHLGAPPLALLHLKSTKDNPSFFAKKKYNI